MNTLTTAGRLIRAEAKLTLRDPFVLVFPILTMLIIGGAFGTKPDRAFAGTNPSHWYVASYFTVVIAATGLIMVPVHLAGYRERGVLRRFAAAGFPRWSFMLAEFTVAIVTMIVSAIVLLIVAAPVYGIPEMHNVGRVVSGLVVGAVAFAGLGLVLGSLLPSARAAQAIGLVLFFPSFLIGAGGPPPHVMGDTLRDVGSVLPLTWVTNAIRNPWLGIGNPTSDLIGVAVLAVVVGAIAVRRGSL